jgi:integrase
MKGSALRSNTRPESRLVLRILACAARELAALRVRDFDAERGKLEIRRSKSGRSRVVVVSNEGAALFRRLAAGRAREEYLLRRGDGQPWARSNQGPPMREACRRAKIYPPIGFHSRDGSGSASEVLVCRRRSEEQCNIL